MREHWHEITIGVLALLLFAAVANFTVLYRQNVALQEELTRTQQTLVTQTQLIVELRKLSVPKEFGSLDELTQWVNNWEKSNKPIVVSILNHTFALAGNTELYSRYWDCDDISEAMQRDALRDGYLMSIALIDGNGVLCGVKVSDLGYHAGNSAVAGNGFYFVEPQTGEIVFIVRRD